MKNLRLKFLIIKRITNPNSRANEVYSPINLRSNNMVNKSEVLHRCTNLIRLSRIVFECNKWVVVEYN